MGGWISREGWDGHRLPDLWQGRGGRITEHEKKREGRGFRDGFIFGACGTAAAPSLGNAGRISEGAPPDERGAKSRVQSLLAAYKTFRSLVDKWIELSIRRGMIEFFAPAAKAQVRTSR